MTPRPVPRESEADLGQLVDDVELIAPWVLLLVAALVGITATGGLRLLIFPSAYVELALVLSDLVPWK